ncbi:unnamed protein product, partial [Iphiclides podalirius]
MHDAARVTLIRAENGDDRGQGRTMFENNAYASGDGGGILMASWVKVETSLPTSLPVANSGATIASVHLTL